MTKPIRWRQVGIDSVVSLVGIALGFGLRAIGVAPWLCWTAFGLILAGRLVHGWVTTQRALPAGPAPLSVRAPLDVAMMATLFGAVFR